MMYSLEPWNDSSILSPPVQMLPCTNFKDVSELKHICNNILTILSKQLPLKQESILLTRFLYKFDKKFRNDIGFRNFKKVNTALRKYFKLNLLREVQQFLEFLPHDQDDIYLPSKQMLEYLLIKLMTFSKLTFRICVCSKMGAIFYLDRVKRGESHWMSLMPFALLCRIWSLTLVLLKHSFSWYSNMLRFSNKLQEKGVRFLPADYNLPDDLEQWLQFKNLDNIGKFNWLQKKKVAIDTLIIDDEENTFDNILQFVNDTNNKNVSENDVVESADVEAVAPKIRKKCKDFELTAITNSNIDCGEIVSREKLQSLLNKNTTTVETKPKNSSYDHSPTDVKNRNSLKQFIEKEEKLRNEKVNDSLTSHLGFMQWHALKNSLLQLYDTLANNKKLQMKFHKIWKEKCLDYS